VPVKAAPLPVGPGRALTATTSPRDPVCVSERYVYIPGRIAASLPMCRPPRYIRSDIFVVAERRPVKWLGTTLNDIRDLSDDIQDQLGYQLYRVQLGLMPNNYKTMRTVGAGVIEIRVSDADNIARLMYVAKFRETVYVLHVFAKKTQRTSQADIDKAKERYREAKNG